MLCYRPAGCMPCPASSSSSLPVPPSVTLRTLAPGTALGPGCHLARAPSMGNPCCCRGTAMAMATAVTRLGQGRGAGKQRVVPRGGGLLRWDLSSQLLELLKMISSLFANELAVSSARSAALPLPSRPNVGSSSLFTLPSPAPVGMEMGRGRGSSHSTGRGGVLPVTSQTQMSHTSHQHYCSREGKLRNQILQSCLWPQS